MNINMNSSVAGLDAASRSGLAFEPRDPVLEYKEPHYHGFCWSCCRPSHSCCCQVRTCRKEAKELLVVPKTDSNVISIFPPDKISTEPQAVLDLLKDTIATEKASNLTGAASNNLAESAPATEDLNSDIRTNVRIGALGRGATIIGGCCCVHLSIEYMPSLVLAGEGLKAPMVLVSVTDSEATTMTWQKSVHAGSIYQIRENIIVTKPGAYLDVVVRNVVARVRWCEIFSC